MSLFTHISALAGALLLFAVQAVAQTSQPLTLTPEQWPRWDASGGFGLFYLRELEREPFDAWDTLGEIRFDVGRYWTTHIKTELGVSLPQSWSDVQYQQFPVAGIPYGGYLTTQEDLRITTLSPAFTYQFLENAFAHPYVSTGVRLGILESHHHRNQEVRTQNGVSYTVPALDRRTTTILARPFLAAGFKSYFNDRAFVRSEGLIAVGPRGAAQTTFRLGFGIDF